MCDLLFQSNVFEILSLKNKNPIDKKICKMCKGKRNLHQKTNNKIQNVEQNE